ncbi:unnamed protein product [Cyprideis torosa]|uniref:Uncharacterized protein n=1 Tax=Cyprideis torosa TaxID=163714 RepID=A0A7R8WC81_9CRUS|nr:unnamed protein product [Cyprideis torosa]CAG0887703.1 unnamed protein product [Cyprideis torosa]
MLSKTAVWAVGICSSLFIGYCIYFDHKRRSSPDYKKKLREMRVRPGHSGNDLIQLGETLLTNGEVEEGIQHLANAVVVCGQPSGLLQVLRQSLPSPVFSKLIQELPLAGQRLTPRGATKDGKTKTDTASLTPLYEDVE